MVDIDKDKYYKMNALTEVLPKSMVCLLLLLVQPP